MVVAITNVGVQTGHLRTDLAAALVGAALMSVLLFPALAGALMSKSPPAGRGVENEVATTGSHHNY